MNVQTILRMKGSDVATIGPAASVTEVLEALSSRRIGALVVTGADDSVIGIVSERDIVYALGRNGRSVLDGVVREIMTRNVVTCRPDDSIDSLMSVMTHGRFRHLPVVDEGQLVGIVSIGDIVKHRMQELEEETGALRDYIAS